MNQMPTFNRRSFIIGTAAVGTGLAIGLDIPFGGPGVVRAADGSPEVNAWVVIRPDDTVVIRIARSEMGQGTLTGLAQLVAEELECDWSKVTTEFPTPGQSVARKRAWGDFSTGGSRGIRTSNDYVRKGGAAARIMLIQAAANEWNVPASECTAANSVITHTPSGRTTTYGKVAEAAAKVEPPTDIKLKDPKDWKIAGKPLKRLDTVDKTNGKMTYGIDVKLPGMLNAAIKACPVFGGKLKSYDEARIAGMKGVKKVVKVDDTAVAVIADTWWHAKTALEALPIVWDEGEHAKVSSASIAKFLEEGLDNAQPAFAGNKHGDVKTAIAGAAKTVEAVYSYPYQNHATMEPMNATAIYTADRCEVWCGTQNGEAAFAAALEVSGLPADKCDVHKMMLGGGFGRRGQTDYVRQAVAIAKQMPGTPIKLLWSREEDMQHGNYHPITQCKMTGAFDADNNLTAFHMRISGQSILYALRPEALVNGMDPATFAGLGPSGDAAFGYTIPNLLIEHAMRNPHVPPGFSGAASTSTTTPSMSNASWMSSRCRSDRIRSNSGARSCRRTPRISACSTRSRKRSAGPRLRRRASIAVSPITWVTGATWRERRRFPSPTATRSRCIASSPRPIPGTPSIRPRSSGRSPARSSTASPRCSMADVPSRTAASNSPTSTTTIRCASTRCRRWNRS
jgi:isoquinoline 1-oxidoreductase beta subunit